MTKRRDWIHWAVLALMLASTIGMYIVYAYVGQEIGARLRACCTGAR